MIASGRFVKEKRATRGARYKVVREKNVLRFVQVEEWKEG